MLRNTTTTWGAVSQIFHWAGGALILLLLIHGWWMVEIPPRIARFAHYSWHASLGYGLLALMILRIAWRWMNTLPEPPPDARAWERIATRLGHRGLYVLILAATISGWALAGTFRRPLDTTFFGLVQVPGIVVSQDRDLHDQLESAHSILAWALALLIIIHIAGALYHLIIKKDRVTQRMLPWI